MTDDLILRLRTLMAEIEARISTEQTPDISPKLRDALQATDNRSLLQASSPSPSPQGHTGGTDLRASDLQRHARPNDYVPKGEGFDEASFIGTGDDDPLGHDAAIRRR